MGHTRTFGSVTLDEDAGTLYQVPHIGEPVGGSVEGASARVDAGVVDSHVSAGRVVAFGVFALAAKKKTGQVFLTVEHPEYAFTYAADFRQEAEMRAFAAEINNAARRQYDPGRPLNRPATVPLPQAADSKPHLAANLAGDVTALVVGRGAPPLPDGWVYVCVESPKYKSVNVSVRDGEHYVSGAVKGGIGAVDELTVIDAACAAHADAITRVASGRVRLTDGQIVLTAHSRVKDIPDRVGQVMKFGCLAVVVGLVVLWVLGVWVDAHR